MMINTQIHNANEYAIDDSALEFVINQEFEDNTEAEFNTYVDGAPISITDQLDEAIRGYVDVDYINQAIPEQLTLTDLPSCGVLTKSGSTESEQTFAMFWSYTVE